MWEVQVRKIGCWLLPTQTLLPACCARQPGQPPLSERPTNQGEFLLEELEILDIVEFVLVMLLGFMPLIIFHWADRRPRLHLAPIRFAFRQDVRRVIAVVRAFVLVWLADSLFGIRK